MSTGGFRERIQTSIREIVFGMEDALVSTLGTITGIAAGTGSTFVVVLSGIVLIFAEALSMSAGSYLSSKSAQEVMALRRKQNTSRLLQRPASEHETLHELLARHGMKKQDINRVEHVLGQEHTHWLHELERCEERLGPSLSPSPLRAAMVMGIFYLFGGIFPLAPYFFLPVTQAILPSIVVTAVMLFGLGSWKAKVTGGHWLKSALEMTTISLSAAVLGYFIGTLVSSFFNTPVV